MIPCYYINLDRSAARRAHMEAEFARNDLRAERVPAIDGRHEITHDCAFFTQEARRKYRLAPDEIACLLSHRKVWQTLADSGAEYAAIFEDDVRLSDKLAQLILRSDWIPAKTECVKLDLSEIDGFYLRPEDIGIDGFSLAECVSDLRSTAAYILSREGAAKLLRATTTIQAPVDLVMFSTIHPHFSHLKYKQLMPAVAAQQAHIKERAFLPASAELSSIDRTKRGYWQTPSRPLRKFGLKKLWREIRRPFKQLSSAAAPAGNAIYYLARFGARRRNVTFIDQTPRP